MSLFDLFIYSHIKYYTCWENTTIFEVSKKNARKPPSNFPEENSLLTRAFAISAFGGKRTMKYF